MEARLTEFSYGYCVTEELANGPGPRLIAAPYFPSLYTEGKKGGGYDVKIGSALFLQFKLCDELSRRTAYETQLGLLQPTFYRFWLHRRDRSFQHQMLIDLESVAGNQVYYIVPKFAEVNALDRAYRQRRVVERSAIFSPTEIGPQPDKKYHRVSFRPDEDCGWFLSKPKQIRVHNKLELLKRAFSVQTAEEADQYSSLDDWLEELAERMRAIRTERVKFKIRLREDDVVVHRTPLEEVAYLARTHFGCELFLCAEPSRNSEGQ
jgi:hypothetical protein